jgi:hypothetical protein
MLVEDGPVTDVSDDARKHSQAPQTAGGGKARNRTLTTITKDAAMRTTKIACASTRFQSICNRRKKAVRLDMDDRSGCMHPLARFNGCAPLRSTPRLCLMPRRGLGQAAPDRQLPRYRRREPGLSHLPCLSSRFLGCRRLIASPFPALEMALDE